MSDTASPSGDRPSTNSRKKRMTKKKTEEVEPEVQSGNVDLNGDGPVSRSTEKKDTQSDDLVLWR